MGQIYIVRSLDGRSSYCTDERDAAEDAYRRARARGRGTVTMLRGEPPYYETVKKYDPRLDRRWLDG